MDCGDENIAKVEAISNYPKIDEQVPIIKKKVNCHDGNCVKTKAISNYSKRDEEIQIPITKKVDFYNGNNMVACEVGSSHLIFAVFKYLALKLWWL